MALKIIHLISIAMAQKYSKQILIYLLNKNHNLGNIRKILFFGSPYLRTLLSLLILTQFDFIITYNMYFYLNLH